MGLPGDIYNAYKWSYYRPRWKLQGGRLRWLRHGVAHPFSDFHEFLVAWCIVLMCVEFLSFPSFSNRFARFGTVFGQNTLFVFRVEECNEERQWNHCTKIAEIVLDKKENTFPHLTNLTNLPYTLNLETPKTYDPSSCYKRPTVPDIQQCLCLGFQSALQKLTKQT